MKTDQNDYDRISDRLEEVFQSLVASLRVSQEGDCTPVNDKQFLTAIRELKHLHGWVKGLASSHKQAMT